MTTSSHRRSPWVSIVIILIAFGLIATYSSFFYGSSNNQGGSATTTVDDEQNNIIYAGKNSIDALTLLKEKYTTEVSDEGFVNSINSIKPEGRQFWALYVNGQPSPSGAKDTITQDGDSIEWKLENY